MRTLCPNLENENALETVLEVPMPEESFTTPWRTMKTPATPHSTDYGGRNAEIQLLLGVVGAPLIPLPISSGHHTTINQNINDYPMEASMAKYIVQQYIAATGGERELNSIHSMFAVGKVKMVASEFIAGDGISMNCNGLSLGGSVMKIKSVRNSGGGEIGGFVLWQKRPDLWSLELVVSGCKISAGSDGKVAWRQTPWHQSHASRGPPRPLRRSVQGLDPKSTANLFSNSICIGEKTIDGEDCFVLKLEAEPSSLEQRSSNNVEIIKHTIWGHFSQKTGLLHHLKDSHLIRIKAHGSSNVFWETTMESLVQDYRTVEGINIAHGGVTTVLLCRFGEHENHSRTKMEEVWTIEELDFNIKGLSMDCFLPPSDLIRGPDHEGAGEVAISDTSARLAARSRGVYPKIGVSKIVDFNPQTFGEC